jgi:hypothetical protein
MWAQGAAVCGVEAGAAGRRRRPRRPSPRAPRPKQPTGRVLCVLGDVLLLQQQRVADDVVARPVLNEHRHSGTDLVEVLRCGEAALLEQGDAEPHALDPQPRRHGFRVLPQHGNELRDVARAAQVGVERVVRGEQEVRVGVDEPRDERAALEVDARRAGAGGGRRAGGGAGVHDLAAARHEGLGVLRGRPGHGQDVAAGVDGGRRRRGRRGRGLAAEEGWGGVGWAVGGGGGGGVGG